jgi:hypothetical protein
MKREVTYDEVKVTSVKFVVKNQQERVYMNIKEKVKILNYQYYITVV